MTEAKTNQERTSEELNAIFSAMRAASLLEAPKDRLMAVSKPLVLLVQGLIGAVIQQDVRAIIHIEFDEAVGDQKGALFTGLDAPEVLRAFSAATTRILAEVLEKDPDTVTATMFQRDETGVMRARPVDDLPDDVKQALGLMPRKTND